MSLVLDASAALAWVYSDENSPAIDRILDQVTEQGAWVPGLWRLEVANALEQGVRRRRIDRAFRDAALSNLMALDISIDAETNVHAWTTTLQIAGRCGLTLYDAAYAELALRRGLPLASLDSDLRAAATLLDIPVLGV